MKNKTFREKKYIANPRWLVKEVDTHSGDIYDK